LADDCGLGKTIQAIGIALYYFDEWPLLVVSPSCVTFQWKAALLDFIPGFKETDIIEINAKNDIVDNSKLIVISSYDSILKANNYIKEPKCVILDESHMLKEQKTKRYENISALVKKTKRLILISATPALSRPVELYSQLNLLRKDIFSDFKKFSDRYCPMKEIKYGNSKRITYGECNLDELRCILQSTCMIRRLKKDVLNELPTKRRVKVKLDCTISETDKSELDNLLRGVKDGDKVSATDASFTKAFKKTAEIKLKSILFFRISN